MRRRLIILAVLLAAIAAALVGWARAPGPPPPSIRIVAVTPLATTDAALRDLLGHHFIVRVTTTAWPLRRSTGPVDGAETDLRLPHWRLYVDGTPFADSSTHTVTTAYLSPGTHWAAAELRGPDDQPLHPPVWSEPIVLHVPDVIRCKQTGWRGGSESGTPTFTCQHG